MNIKTLRFLAKLMDEASIAVQFFGDTSLMDIIDKSEGGNIADEWPNVMSNGFSGG